MTILIHLFLFTVITEENIPANIRDATSETLQDMPDGATGHISVKTKNASDTEKGIVNLKMYNFRLLMPIR